MFAKTQIKFDFRGRIKPIHLKYFYSKDTDA